MEIKKAALMSILTFLWAGNGFALKIQCPDKETYQQQGDTWQADTKIDAKSSAKESSLPPFIVTTQAIEDIVSIHSIDPLINVAPMTVGNGGMGLSISCPLAVNLKPIGSNPGTQSSAIATLTTTAFSRCKKKDDTTMECD